MKKCIQVIGVFASALMFLSVNVYAQGNNNVNSEPDSSNLYPNVASVRGLFFNPDATGPKWTARYSCSGSLLHADSEKIVILTAAHCTDAWIQGIATLGTHSVGVSFDLNNVINGSFVDATYYVQGGVPISLPAKDAPFEKLDYGLVVFPVNATNSVGQTIQGRWPALTPVTIAPDTEYVSNLVSSINKPQDNLGFTAVGYGIGEPLNGGYHDLSTYLVRHIAHGLTYNALNPGNDTLRLSMNSNKSEGFTCNGDSGGPIFYMDSFRGLVQVSLVSGGDSPCRATNTGPGFGKQAAFDFINCGRITGDASAVAACVRGLFEQ